MILNKGHLIAALVGLFLGLVIGFCVGKGMYDTPEKVKIERDTVSVTDTIVKYQPKPIEVEKVRTEYQYLPVVKNVYDTIVKTDVVTLHDSVLVQVPITSKHYGSKDYDAWVSGYNPSLDSIRTYNTTQYITETITKTKQQSRFSLGINGGYGYNFNGKVWGWQVGIGGQIRIF